MIEETVSGRAMSSSNVRTTSDEMSNAMYTDASNRIRDNSSKIGINIGIAIVIWLVGNLVFIPISRGLFVGIYAMTQLVDVIILIALLVLVFRIITEIRAVTDSTAVITAYYSRGSGAIEQSEVSDFRSAFRGFLYVLIVAAAFLLVSAQLDILYPALAGVVLLIIVVWAVYTLFHSGMALSRTVDRHFKQWGTRLAAAGASPSPSSGTS
jgi:hypothetical protein